MLRLSKDEALVEELANDYTRTTKLSTADRAMLDYAAKLTREPWSVRAEDVQRLREAGFTDEAILHINQVVAYFAYVNRVADGLGVELEADWKGYRRHWE